MDRASPLNHLALVHSTACRALLEDGELNDAIHYCIAQGIEPPFPPCDQRAAEYADCLARAAVSLCDYGWWEKRLKLHHVRRAHIGLPT
jgi:hypothetical protein